MRDILPAVVFNSLRDRYIAGTADAEAQFLAGAADEDSLTGALGQAISMAQPLSFQTSAGTFSVHVTWKKIRGRGLNAPERLYGSDGIFQIAVYGANGETLRSKAVPFQSKTNWRGRSASVLKQSSDIQRSLQGGLVLNFTDRGYEACTTEAAIAASGNRREVERSQGIRPLGQVLGNDFLECTVGRVGLFFDPEAERYALGADHLAPANAITTIVRRQRVA